MLGDGWEGRLQAKTYTASPLASQLSLARSGLVVVFEDSSVRRWELYCCQPVALRPPQVRGQRLRLLNELKSELSGSAKHHGRTFRAIRHIILRRFLLRILRELDLPAIRATPSPIIQSRLLECRPLSLVSLPHQLPPPSADGQPLLLSLSQCEDSSSPSQRSYRCQWLSWSAPRREWRPSCGC